MSVKLLRRKKPNFESQWKGVLNGYIVFYRDQYPHYRGKMPDAELGEIARVIGAQWKKLTTDQKAKYNKQATQ